MTTTESIVDTRTTKYIQKTLTVLDIRRHATNAEILSDLRVDYLNLTATTVHRITARLYARGIIGCAPLAEDGSCRYDITPQTHHHFSCMQCKSLCDIPNTTAFDALVDQMKELSDDCASVDTLTAQGLCKNCFKKGRI